MLDVGGAEGLFAGPLEGYHVTSIDIEARELVDVVGSGAALPFRSGSFDVVVGLDLLEHVAAEARPDVLNEMARVSSATVIIAGPFSSPDVEAAERYLRGLAEALWNEPHPWLEEHFRFGLPNLPDTVNDLERLVGPTVVFGSNPIPMWRELQEANFVGARLGETAALDSLHVSLLERFMDESDGTEPSYRHFLVASAVGGKVDLPSVGGNLEPWIGGIGARRAAMIARAEDRTRGSLLELDASLRKARAGWEAAVEHAERLEDSLSDAEAGWAATVELAEDSAERLRIAEEAFRERIGVLESSVAGLNAQLVSRVACWRSDVAGPPVTAEGADADRIAEYDAWVTRADERPEPIPVATDLRFSILTPVYNPPAALLEALIRSVRAQTYANWELVLADGSDAPHVAPICDRFASLDPRVRIVRHDNLGISANTNLAADHATGDWFLLVDHDDELAPHALAAFAEGIENAGGLAHGYSDEDKIDETGRRSDPFFKPDWSPDLLRTLNYITHLQGVRRDVWEKIGGLRSETDGAQDYDLALRASAAAGGAFHIDDVLYHWRVHSDSTAADVGVKPHAHRAGRRALEDYAQQHAPDSWIEFGTGPTSHRFRYPVAVQPLSVIIPFRDGARLTETCLTGIARTGTALPLEVLLIDNQSSDPATQERIGAWQDRYSWVRVLRYDEPFNFQRLNNWAVAHATGDLLLFLNNDTEPFHEGWVEALAEHAQRPEVGAVGGRLFYPNGIVQHAGVAVGIGGYAEHPWAGLHPDAWTPAGPSYWTRNFLSVTAACLMVQRSKFEEVGGFDERFTIGGGDVALGLALREHGYWNVMTPYSRLIHHESVSRGTVVPESDLLISRAVYEPFLDGRDPFYNSNLTLEDTRCGLR